MSDEPPEPAAEKPEPGAPEPAPAAVAASDEPDGREPAKELPESAAKTAEPPAPLPPRATESPVRAAARRYGFYVVPVIALLELAAHLIQTHSVVSDAEWLAARDAVRGIAKPEDLVAVAPYWADPVGRELFRDELLSIAREARPDATRFPRAVEVSIRGQHLSELADWKVESTRKVGPVTLTLLDNPSYRPLKDDLVDHVAPGRMTVSAVSGGAAADCNFLHAKVETGGLGFGPAIPADRFVCPQSGMIGATVMQPGDYRPHRCLFAPPLPGGKTMRVRFENVVFGQTLHGHAGIDWDSTAHPDEPPVTLVWKLGDRTIGRVVAGNDDGWKSFALDTRELDGTTGEITAEISCPSARNRLYCFEADTR